MKKTLTFRYGRINLYDAVIVSENITPTLSTFDLNAHDSSQIYNPREVYDALVKWEEKTIMIKGLYQGYTQSTGGDGKVLERRIDLGPDDDHLMGCAFDIDPGVGDQLSAGVDVITVKGVISWELSYGRPYMTQCELVK